MDEARIKELERDYKLNMTDHGLLTIEQMRALKNPSIPEQPYDGYVTVFMLEICGDVVGGVSVIARHIAEYGGDVASFVAHEKLAFLEAIEQEIHRRESIHYKLSGG